MWNETETKSATQMSVPELKKEVWRLKGIIDRQAEKIETLEKQVSTYTNKWNEETPIEGDYSALKRAYDVLAYKYKLLRTTRSLMPVDDSDIIEQIGNYYGIKRDELMSRSRKMEIVKARNVIFYVLYESGMSLKKIGLILLKDHSTVIHGRDNYIRYSSSYPQSEVDFINGLIKR